VVAMNVFKNKSLVSGRVQVDIQSRVMSVTMLII
jgi:hypothetical protein